MIDLTKIDDSVRMARGDYSTVRAALEDEKKNLQKLTGEELDVFARILRQMQPDNDAVPEKPAVLLSVARVTLGDIEAAAERIVALAQQKHDLKAAAWGRK